MSLLLRTSRFAVARPAMAQRAFQTSSVRALNETHSHPNQAAENEKHKQDQLKKQKEGKGHWKPELASSSEEAIAADRSHKDGESVEELQKKTKEHSEKKHKQGTSQDTGL